MSDRSAFYHTLRKQPPIKIKGIWFISRYSDIEDCLKNHPTFSSNKLDLMLAHDLDNKETEIHFIREILDQWILHRDDGTRSLVKNSLIKILSLEFKSNLSEKVAFAFAKSIKNISKRTKYDLKNDLVIPFLENFAIAFLKISTPLHHGDLYFHAANVASLLSDLNLNSENISVYSDSLRFLDNLTLDSFPKDDDPLGLHSQQSLILYALVFNSVNLISNAIFKLLKNDMPFNDIELEAFLNEVIRLEAPLQAVMRIAQEDIYIQHKEIRKGDPVALILGSGNEDILDESNLGKGYLKLLSYGKGIHACVGKRLSYELAKGFLVSFSKNIDCLELKHFEWSKLFGFKSLESFKVEVISFK
ncbi:MAG: cytochrome P450 [Flavobacterium sp.]|nr:MAG: cytochrome P450 [Flavobacterium sp.]